MPKYGITDGSSLGYIEVIGDKLVFSLGKTFDTRVSYIQSIEKTQDLSLNKCKAKLTYYSLMAELRAVEFIINQNDLAGLKKTTGK
ncbi:MAG: hypothetical protein V1722_02245 [Candidatus Micrarchaeota archaeon]